MIEIRKSQTAPMAGEFDFEPESDDVLNGIADAGKPMGSYVHVCRELRASRAALREWVEAKQHYLALPFIEPHPEKVATRERLANAEGRMRALVAHVGGGGE